MLYEVYHELQVATGPSMPRESDSPSPVAEESLPAASEEVCADLRAAAAPPRLPPWTNRSPPTMQRSRQAFEGHQRLSTPGHPPPPMTRADPGDAEEITAELALNVIFSR